MRDGTFTDGGVIDGGVTEGTEGADGMEGIEGVDGIDGVLTEGTDGVSSEGVLTGLYNVGVFKEGVWPDKRPRIKMPAIAVLLTFASTFPSVPATVMKSGNGT